MMGGLSQSQVSPGFQFLKEARVTKVRESDKFIQLLPHSFFSVILKIPVFFHLLKVGGADFEMVD